jgi:hypothetical protein
MTKAEIKTQLDSNLARVENLVRIYETHLAGTGQGRRPIHSTDLLRSAVVFLHASLEDLLRNIAAERLPGADEKTINEIPLAGISAEGRPEKFLLGRLTAHRGKSVDQIIHESVQSHLQRSNYNSVEDIVRVLQDSGISPDPCRVHFPVLSEFMARRHQIVHRADKNEQHGSGQHRAQSIGRHTVREWALAVAGVANTILAQM